MKSPKNVVKALVLTSLIVSSISAMGDAEQMAIDALDAGRQAAAPVAPAVVNAVNAATEAVAPVAASYWDSIKGFGTSAKDAVVNNPKTSMGVVGAVATLGGLKYYGFKNAWNKAKAAAVSVKDTIVKYKKTTAAVVAATAGTFAAAYFCPEQRATVVNGLKSGFDWACGKAKSVGSTLWEHKGKTAAAVGTLGAAAYGLPKAYRYFRPAGEVVPAEEVPTPEEVVTPTTPTRSTPVATPAAQDENSNQPQTLGAVLGQKGQQPRKTYSADYHAGLAGILGARKPATKACPTGNCK